MEKMKANWRKGKKKSVAEKRIKERDRKELEMERRER